MRVKALFWLIGTAFSITLAAIIGWRLSSEAMAVLVGVAAGVLASIPTSLIVVWVTTRHWRAEREMQVRVQAQPAAQGPQMPVVVVAPPTMTSTGMPGWGQSYAPQLPAPPRRQFTVIGQDPLWDSAPAVAARQPVEDVWPS